MQQQPHADDRKADDDKTWKFFDPLSSPSADDEMLILEARLEEKAKKANQKLVLEQRPDIIASTEVHRRARPPARDIDSLINNNLSKLRSLSPKASANVKVAQNNSDGSNLTYDRLDVAKSVLVELRGKTTRRKPPPLPPPPQQPGSLKPSRPPEPPKPRPRRPPAPKIDLMDLDTEIVLSEPLYASVKKDEINRPQRPPRPTDKRPRELEVKVDVQVHHHHYDNTPTNAEMFNDLNDKANEDEDPEPSVPLRTSSILPRPPLVSKGETFRSYINLKDLDPPSVFPPDKNSPITSPSSSSTSKEDHLPRPPKVSSLPFRSASVASSIKSRSIIYAPA